MTESSLLEVTPTDAPILARQVTIAPAAGPFSADLTAIFDAGPHPSAGNGLVAYVDAVPAGWIGVQPRPAGPGRRAARIRRRATGEDDATWAVTSLAVRPGYRGRGLTYHLAKAAIVFARDRGAHVLEADPAQTPESDGAWGEPHVGATQVFTDAGFTRASPRSPVLQVNLRHPSAGIPAETRGSAEPTPPVSRSRRSGRSARGEG
jgi:GNAT superfamily N-acetyltransferase